MRQEEVPVKLVGSRSGGGARGQLRDQRQLAQGELGGLAGGDAVEARVDRLDPARSLEGHAQAVRDGGQHEDDADREEEVDDPRVHPKLAAGAVTSEHARAQLADDGIASLP